MKLTQALQLVLIAGATVFASSCSSAPVAAPAADGATMQAITYHEYGTADVLQLEDIPMPVPGDHQVLLKVRAAAVNPLDWHYIRGTPYLMRISAGFRKPKSSRLGADVAGEVVSVGKSVTRFKPGDAVYGGGWGAFATYMRIAEDRIALKPAHLSFEEAAAVPVAAITALQGLRDKGALQPGEKVLINGASGGVGSFAVQIAKSMGAEVTGVCSTRNVELVRALGADHVIDYTKEDFAAGEPGFDLLLDMVGNRSLADMRRALKPHGRVVMIGGGGPDAGNWIGGMAKPLNALLVSPFVSQKFGFFMSDMLSADLEVVNALMVGGKVKPVIDRAYALSEVPDAIRYLEAGHARGKVVISVAP
jgi:NADPH:quinone reductase-like Zn-dependent oxidoreductase